MVSCASEGCAHKPGLAPGSEPSRRSGPWPGRGWRPPRSLLRVRKDGRPLYAKRRRSSRLKMCTWTTPGPSPARNRRSRGGGRTVPRRSPRDSAFSRGDERRLLELASSQPCRRRRGPGCGAVEAQGRELGFSPHRPRTQPASRTRSSVCAPDSGSGCPWRWAVLATGAATSAPETRSRRNRRERQDGSVRNL